MDEEKKEKKEKKKRKHEREDGRLCKNVTIGRNEDGSLKRKMIYANTQAELNLKVAELLLQKDKGVIIDDKNKTVDVWADEWLQTYKVGFRPNTIRDHRTMVNKYIKPNFKGVRLKDLKQYQIKKVLNEITLNTVPKHFLMTFNQMLDCAVENDLVSKNAAKGLTARKPVHEAKTPLTDEQFDIIKNTPHEIQNICIFLVYSGLRIGELINLTRQDINLKTNKLDIHGEVKTPYSNRKVPIVQPLIDLIKQLDNERIKNIDADLDYFFNDNGNKYLMNKLSQSRYEYCELLGFDFTYHQCRHTCATSLYNAGVGIKEAQEWLGHASFNTTMDIYTHLSEKNKEAATTKINKYLKSN